MTGSHLDQQQQRFDVANDDVLYKQNQAGYSPAFQQPSLFQTIHHPYDVIGKSPDRGNIFLCCFLL